MAVAVRSFTSTTYASRTNTTLTAPSGLADNDILIAVIFAGASGTAPTVTASAGFSALSGSPTSVNDTTGFAAKFNVFWKRASSESGSYTFTHTTGSSQGVLLAISGAATSGTPIDASSANSGVSDSGTFGTSTALSVTTTVANDLLLYLAHDWEGSGALSPPTGMTEIFDGLVYAASMALGAAGATGDVTQTNGNNVNGTNPPWSAFLVAIKPDTGTGVALSGRAAAIAAKFKASTSRRSALAATASLEVCSTANMRQQSVPTVSPILVSATATNIDLTGSPKTVSGIAVQNGDLIVAHAMMEAATGGVLSVSTSAGSTAPWILIEDLPGVTEPNQGYLRTWWTTAAATGSISVALARAGSEHFGGVVKVYRNAAGLGATATANNGTGGSGAPSVPITTTKSNSVIDFASVDWNATSGTATFVSSVGTPSSDFDAGSIFVRVFSSHVTTGDPGSKTIGLSAPNTQRYLAVAIEVLGLGQVGALSGAARIFARGGSTFSGVATGLSGKSTAAVSGRPTASGRLSLAGKTSSRFAARLTQTIGLQFQSLFFPAMRGTLTTTAPLGSSAGTALKFKLFGAPARSTGLSSKAATTTRAGASASAGASMSGLAQTTTRARSTFSGSIVLAIQTQIFPAMRGALNAAAVPTAIALAAATAIMSRAKATVSGRTALSAQTTSAARMSGGSRGVAYVAGRAAAQARASAAVLARSALLATGAVRSAARGAMGGSLGLMGRAAIAVASRVTLPGSAIALIARATTAARIAANVTGRTSLAARSAMTVKASASPPRLVAFLSAIVGIASATRAGVSVVANITTAARAKIAFSARSTFSGVVGLAARAKMSTAGRINRPFMPLVGRAVVRASASALLFVLRPVIPTPVSSNPGRLGRLRASMEKAFGEAFDIQPMTAAVDVNSRVLPDISRDAKLGITGIWQGPTTSKLPIARGNVADDKAHRWNASFPSVRFDSALVAGTRKGDKLTRKLDGSVYEVVRVVPDGFGRTTLQLSTGRTLH